jgi:hypothetical protein
MFFGAFFGMCVYAIAVNRAALRDHRRLQKLISEARRTRIADAPMEQPIILTGRARGKDDAVVATPFTGVDALWARARVQTNIGQVVHELVESVDAIVIDDGSGCAIVRLAGADVRRSDASVQGHRDRITGVLSARGMSDAGNFTYEAVLSPGDNVSVLGRAGSTSGYRESAKALELGGDVTIFDPLLVGVEHKLRQRYIGCATYGAIAFGLATLLATVLAFR